MIVLKAFDQLVVAVQHRSAGTSALIAIVRIVPEYRALGQRAAAQHRQKARAVPVLIRIKRLTGGLQEGGVEVWRVGGGHGLGQRLNHAGPYGKHGHPRAALVQPALALAGGRVAGGAAFGCGQTAVVRGEHQQRVLPLAGGSQMHLMRAESPGPSVGKLVPKMRHTARLLYLIYLGLTVSEVIFLLIGGMPIFDSLTITFGSVGTGGFGIKNSSCADYTPYIQWVITIFMILSGINFNAYYLIVFRQFKKAFSMEEVRTYLGIIIAATGIIFFELVRNSMNTVDAFRYAAFQVGSIFTSTGYATADFNEWTALSRTILVILMFIGACAGSTGGGIKVSRFITVFKTGGKELNSYIHPKSIKKIKMDGKPIEHEIMRATNVYFITFFALFIFSLLIITLEEKDLVTNFTAVIATMNNIGPGLEMVGPTQNFSHFSPLSKYVLMFDMLAGRLELFPMLLLFVPTIWKEFFTHNTSKETKKQDA